MTNAPQELEKYEGIYREPAKYSRYGHSNHGANAFPILEQWGCRSLVDIGCGFNEFVHATKGVPGMKSLGVDFACPGADVRACGTSLPFFDKQFDVLTAFDMLEHILPEQVGVTLMEFSRVSHRFIFSISYVPSKITWRGKNLHPTVRHEEWWIEQIKNAGAREVRKQGRYLVGHWNGQPPLMADGASCVLVGNGPSVCLNKLGSVIDKFDEVVRFNGFKIKGLEEQTGSRTTIWSTFGRGVLPADAEERPTKVIFIHGNNGKPAYEPQSLWRIPLTFFNERRREVQEGSGLEGDAKARLLPSSGLLVASWLLREMGIRKLSLIGFDHFKKDRSGQHHYWSPKTFGRPKEHSGDYEEVAFAQMLADGQVTYLG